VRNVSFKLIAVLFTKGGHGTACGVVSEVMEDNDNQCINEWLETDTCRRVFQIVTQGSRKRTSVSVTLFDK
jgi:hypothetical protein